MYVACFIKTCVAHETNAFNTRRVSVRDNLAYGGQGFAKLHTHTHTHTHRSLVDDQDEGRIQLARRLDASYTFYPSIQHHHI
ncbi:unnamed protein product [Fusarium graminearum]|uniref:Uncharacterized protein n=1 Tax=Gibberella zeae TaxID=5518 RepID=A0A9N8WXX6_GIBZA|nr:unnamed protein product [Fusarium graminearum]